MNILITLCARGGSKGVPGKNIKLLNGKHLIYYSLRTATLFKKCFTETDIVLSTDSEEIKKVVSELGFEIDISYTRPDHLATDIAGKMEAIMDVLGYSEEKNKKSYDFVLDLDITSPLRNLADLKAALNMLLEKSEAYNIFSVSNADRNPYFNMVEEKQDGFYGLCKKGSFLSRQSAPKVYEMNASFYFYRKSFFDNNFQTAITEKSIVYKVPHFCFDIDHLIDFEFITFLIANDKLDFEF